MAEFRSAQIADFNARLLTAASVSFFLGEWCGHPVRVVKESQAERIPEVEAEMRRRMNLASDEALDYRSVRLVFGETVLSQAEVWYRRALLTPAMHQTLQFTDLPFGLVVSPLGQRRETYAVAELPSPLILEHRAVLMTGEGEPLGVVHERYTEAVFRVHSQTAS